MPHLVTLLPCEKVIVDREGMPSLIRLFQNINIALSEGQQLEQIPREAITYKEWALFTEWKIDDAEVGTKAEQIFELMYPDNAIAPLKGRIPFDFKTPGIHRNHQNIIGFPIGQEGPYTIRVWLERGGQRISEIGTYQMHVVHKIPAGATTIEIWAQSPIKQ
jgi:hypothetical protein